jgi:hypothetical protein
MKNDNLPHGCIFLWFLIILFAVIGEVKCVYKAFTCNWDPIGKAEVMYTAASICGLGAVIGYINIEDK